MLCPLRKRVNSASFENCYKKECEWWVGKEEKDWGNCAIKILGDLSIAIFAISQKEDKVKEGKS